MKFVIIFKNYNMSQGLRALPKDLLLQVIANINRVYVVFSTFPTVVGSRTFLMEKLFHDYDKAHDYVQEQITIKGKRFKKMHIYFFEGKRSELPNWMEEGSMEYIIEEYNLE